MGMLLMMTMMNSKYEKTERENEKFAEQIPPVFFRQWRILSRNVEKGRQCISPVVIYRKCTQ